MSVSSMIIAAHGIQYDRGGVFGIVGYNFTVFNMIKYIGIWSLLLYIYVYFCL